ncbi:MAG: CoA transferase [Deltaproteobacteria bacterium]|nr:CoA transferase [Deltaproteobacteria bacterium]
MPGPLHGLKVLDFTTLLPGPYATMTLADMGADVLRIISGTRGDPVSYLPPFIPGTDVSAVMSYLGRGKRCMSLNLKDGRATKIVRQLIGRYDILIEQFRPGVMAGLALDYPRLSAVNPALIYCSLTGYGQTGPMRLRAGHDINYLARSGLMSYSGKKESGPSLTGMQIADIASGSQNAVIGILAAVVRRNATGKGQYVDCAMTDGCLAFNAMTGISCLTDGREPQREETLLNGGSLYDFYETKDGKYLSVGALEPQFLSAFCNVIGRPDLAESGAAPEDAAAAKQEVRQIIKTRTRDEWTAIFDRVDACVEPVLSLGEALHDPQTKARRMVVDCRAPQGGRVRQLASPIKFSESKQTYRKAAVARGIGRHTRGVLKELGYTDAEIAEFKKTGVFD